MGDSASDFNGDPSSLADGRYLFVLADYDSVKEAGSLYLKWFSENQSSARIIWVGYGTQGPPRFIHAGKGVSFSDSVYRLFISRTGFELKEGAAYAMTATIENGNLKKNEIMLSRVGASPVWADARPLPCHSHTPEPFAHHPFDAASSVLVVSGLQPFRARGQATGGNK